MIDRTLPEEWFSTEIELIDGQGELGDCRLLDANAVGVLVRFSSYTVFYPWTNIRFVRKPREAKR